MDLEKQIAQIDTLQKRILASRPLKKVELENLKNYFRIGLTYSTNALEGNTLTESETKIVIEEGLTIGGKPLRDHQEAMGHSEAFDHAYKLAKSLVIGETEICQLHQLFYYRIDQKNAGKYRKAQVYISGSAYLPPNPKILKKRMGGFVEHIPIQEKKLHPVAYAAWLHKEIADIHPFIDGNGRTARLVMNLALLQHGFPITIIPPILRKEYIDTLEKGRQSSDNSFGLFIFGRVYEAQKEYLRLVSA